MLSVVRVFGLKLLNVVFESSLMLWTGLHFFHASQSHYIFLEANPLNACLIKIKVYSYYYKIYFYFKYIFGDIPPIGSRPQTNVLLKCVFCNPPPPLGTTGCRNKTKHYAIIFLKKINIGGGRIQ